MATHDEIVQEYYEADHAYRTALGRAVCRDDMVALPKDVREARAHLECEDEAQRLTTARIAFEQMQISTQERWVAAHEDMYGVRKLAAGR